MTKYDVPPKAELIEKVLEDGLTNAQLAEEYLVSERVIKRWLNLYEIRRIGSTLLMERAAYTLMKHGFSGREVATVLDTTHTRVYEMTKRYRNWRESR